MPAHIAKGLDGPGRAAHHKGAFAAEIHRAEIAFLRYIIDMTDDLPVIFEQIFLFQLKQSIGMVTPSGQTPTVPLLGNRIVAVRAFQKAGGHIAPINC